MIRDQLEKMRNDQELGSRKKARSKLVALRNKMSMKSSSPGRGSSMTPKETPYFNDV